MKDVLTLILGGGRGTRLYPLTKHRSEPAVPIAGKYRLIDIPISNAINSGLQRIFVLTQYLSVSLHRHIANTFKFDQFGSSFVEVLAAQQTNEAADWYRGTADAVRQNIRYVHEDACTDVLILCGDQLYRMDFRQLLETHQATGADVTMAVVPVHASPGQQLRHRPPRRFAADCRSGGEAANGGPIRQPANAVADSTALRFAQSGPRIPGEHGHLSVQTRSVDRPVERPAPGP